MRASQRQVRRVAGPAQPPFLGGPVDFMRSARSLVGGLSAGRWVRINTYSPSAAATVAVTGFDSAKYSHYVLCLDQFKPATDGQHLYLQSSTDGGSSFDSAGTDYSWGGPAHLGGSGYNGTNGTAGQIQLSLNAAVGNAAGEEWSGHIQIINPGAAARCRFLWNLFNRDTSGNTSAGCGAAERTAAADVNALQLVFASGNIASGTATFYGLRL